MAREIRVTKEGHERLQRDLEQERARLEETTRILRELSGSSDDYDDTGLEEAKRQKALVEERLDDLEDQLSRAVVIEPHELDHVDLGATVELEDEDGERFSVQVVSPVEAGVLEGDVPKVSDESPLGKALMGHSVGDSVRVETRDGATVYSVRSIG